MYLFRHDQFGVFDDHKEEQDEGIDHQLVDLCAQGQNGDEIEGQRDQSCPCGQEQQPGRVPKEVLFDHQIEGQDPGKQSVGRLRPLEKGSQIAGGEDVFFKKLIGGGDFCKKAAEIFQGHAAQPLVVHQLGPGDIQQEVEDHVVEDQSRCAQKDIACSAVQHPVQGFVFQESQNAVEQKQPDGVTDEGLVCPTGCGEQRQPEEPAPAIVPGAVDRQRIEHEAEKVRVRCEQVREDGGRRGKGHQESRGQDDVDRMGQFQDLNGQPSGYCDGQKGDQAGDHRQLEAGAEDR